MNCSYKEIRKNIQTGDCILWRSNKWLGRLIRWRACLGCTPEELPLRDFSHASTVVLSLDELDTLRVRVIEAVSSGAEYRFLSDALCSEHGEAFLIPMSCSLTQMVLIKKEADRLNEQRTKYDFWATLIAALWTTPLDLATGKANCSELFWHLMRHSKRVKAKIVNGKEIAPMPGEIPLWTGIIPIKIEMDCT